MVLQWFVAPQPNVNVDFVVVVGADKTLPHGPVLQ